MAKRRGKFLTGAVGTVVMYEINGVEYMRSLPVEYEQTEGTKNCSTLFGQSAKMSAFMRASFDALLRDLPKKKVMLLYNEALRKWLRACETMTAANSLAFIDRFQFNEEVSLAEKLFVPVSVLWDVPGKISIQLPELIPTHDITAPKSTETIQWLFGVEGCAPDISGSPGRHILFSLDMPYTGSTVPATAIEIPFQTIPGELAVVALGIRYIVNKKGKQILEDNEKWIPVGIVGSYFEKL